VRVAVDTGGTFTDCVALRDDGALFVEKRFSTPDDPARAVLDGVTQCVMRGGEPLAEVVHGSTVATNAVLERRGARVVLVTTAGFEDVLLIGRQDRPSLYALAPVRPLPLVPSERCVGVRERLEPTGEVATPLTGDEVVRVVAEVRARRPEAIAISLLHAYANPAHEVRLGEALAALGVSVSLSSGLLPEFREYERTATTVLNAYVGPRMAGYLGRLEAGLVPGADAGALAPRLVVMASNGGTLSAARAAAEPVRTVLSGPAGGVVGAARAARALGIARVISFDMGGTSTDVAAFAGEPALTVDAAVGGVPVRLPVVDIHTVGAGGGSLACLDAGGALCVGPQSAGADPGPACYGRGGGATVTDANLVLGRLAPAWFLGGAATLDVGLAHQALAALACDAGIAPDALARGVLRVANAAMARAISAVTLQRGHDPRDFALVAFGGAGGMHACDLAAELGIPRVVLPAFAGALSALGMLAADRVKDASLTVLRPAGEDRAGLDAAFGRLAGAAAAELAVELGASSDDPAGMECHVLADLRYRGQSFELTLPWGADPCADFHAAHRAAFGHDLPDAVVEVVNLRVRVRVPGPSLPLHDAVTWAPGEPRAGTTRLAVAGGWAEAPVLDRARLRPGAVVEGPALVVEPTATAVVPPGWAGAMHPSGALVLEAT
jgi:N-methylhydantoinase A